MTAPASADEARALIARHLEAVDRLWEHVRVIDPDVYVRRPSAVLTVQQRRIARAYAVSGTALTAVARDLHISINTAKTHLRLAYAALGVHSRRELRRALLAAEQVPEGEAA